MLVEQLSSNDTTQIQTSTGDAIQSQSSDNTTTQSAVAKGR